jgi:NADPH:quinone reductase-like Zn-dependent oxidoreductase
MNRISTQAWILRAAPDGNDESSAAVPTALNLENISFSGPEAGEVLVEPLYGSWEANIDHAVSRSPVDICRQRGEEKIVPGNWGVVRVLACGTEAASCKEGDLRIVLPFGECDPFGYAETVYGYDAPRTIGILAKRTKIKEQMLLPIPPDSRHTIVQWAACCRCFVAWDNWRVAHSAWRAQMNDVPPGEELVFGWGGGVALAELQLARRSGFMVAMTAGSDARLEMLRNAGIIAIDRRKFLGLHDDSQANRAGYRHPDYDEAESAFLGVIRDLTGNKGAAIIVDNIGAPLHRATVKSLARQGVIATTGWKHGMRVINNRAMNCINRQLSVHTHVWRQPDSADIRDYLETDGWMPEVAEDSVYGFEDVGMLAADYAQSRIDSYFPVFQVNPEL